MAIKRVPVAMDEVLYAAIQAAAKQNGRSMTQEAAARLGQSLGADLVIGWVKLDRWGELDDKDCPECGQEIGQAYVGLLQSGGTYGPVCDICATNE